MQNSVLYFTVAFTTTQLPGYQRIVYEIEFIDRLLMQIKTTCGVMAETNNTDTDNTEMAG